MEPTSKARVKHPIVREWKIRESEFHEWRNSTNKILKSDYGHIFDDHLDRYFKYCLGFNREEAKSGKAYIYFYLSSMTDTIENLYEADADLTISIVSTDCPGGVENTYTKDRCYFGGYLCTIDELFYPEKRYIVNGEMNIKVEGFIEFKKPEPKNAGTVKKLGNTTMWNNKSQDFTILVDGQEITTQKCFLADHSPAFAAMFLLNSKEAQENKAQIADFSFEIVKAAIELCRQPGFVSRFQLDSKMLLFKFFHKYNFQLLKDVLENSLIPEINESNVCRLANLSLALNALKLGNKCAEFLRKFLKTIPDSDILDFRIFDFCKKC